MEPMRVLYLDHVTHLSGAEQSLFDLVVGLAGGPVEPIVVLPEDGPLATQLRGAGVLVRKVKMSKRLLETSRTTLTTRPLVAIMRFISFVAVGLRVRKIVKEMRPAVIHTNTLKAHLMAIIPAKLTGTPLIWHVRDIIPKGWVRRAFLLCARFPDKIVVISRAVGQSMGRNKTVYRKLRLIPNGIRVDTFDDRDEGAALRAEIGAGAKDPVVGIVGRLAPWKGQDVFVHAAAMVADRYPKAKFAVVGTPMFGDDDFQHDLASLVYQYELDAQMTFAGWRSAQEAMAAIDIVVHASVEPEPFGRTIVEAMAAGRPVIAAAGGAVQEILPPNAGIVVPPGRPEILADALEGLLSDRKMREQMGANGKAAAGRFFDVRRTIAAVGSLYGEVARENAKSLAKRRRRGRFFGLLPAKKQPARSDTRMQPMRGRMQEPRRPMSPNRRPPVLRPDAPDAIPAGRPMRRTPAASQEQGPVRRTARIEIDLENDGFDDEETVAAPRRREPSKRSIPADAPHRPLRRPAIYEGGHLIRRPAALDDPAYVEPDFDPEIDLIGEEEEPLVPTRRDVPSDVRNLLPEPQNEPEPERVRAPAKSTKKIPVTTEATARKLDDDRYTVPTLKHTAPTGPVAVAPEAPPPAATTLAPRPSAVSVVMPMPAAVEHKPRYEAVKRLMDIVLATLVLLAGMPLWVLTALLIKLDSPGAVFFKGTVWGKDCKPFTYWKFRSMKTDGGADGHKDFIASYLNDEGISGHNGKTVYKFVGDARITRIGKLIRKFSIDEVPQLMNVIKGDMSLVGPRPPLQYEYELYDDWAKQRLVVRPGLTGLQQTYARHSAAFTEKVEMDLAYIRDRSLMLDLTILLKTIPAAFKGE